MIEIQSYLDLSEAEYEAHLESAPGPCWYCERESVEEDRNGRRVCEQCWEDDRRAEELDQAWERHTCVEWKKEGR